MKRDSIYGPPKEIFDPGEDFAKKKSKRRKQNDSSDSDVDLGFEEEGDEDENAFNQAKLRKYEIEKMKYYYAIVHCNNP